MPSFQTEVGTFLPDPPAGANETNWPIYFHPFDDEQGSHETLPATSLTAALTSSFTLLNTVDS